MREEPTGNGEQAEIQELQRSEQMLNQIEDELNNKFGEVTDREQITNEEAQEVMRLTSGLIELHETSGDELESVFRLKQANRPALQIIQALSRLRASMQEYKTILLTVAEIFCQHDAVLLVSIKERLATYKPENILKNFENRLVENS